MREISSDIDLADSSYQSCEMRQRDLIVSINSWDEKTIKVKFHNTIGFTCKTGSFISGIYESENESLLLEEALELYYEKAPKPHQFKVYSIIDIEESKLFEVIAEEVFVTKE